MQRLGIYFYGSLLYLISAADPKRFGSLNNLSIYKHLFLETTLKNFGLFRKKLPKSLMGAIRGLYVPQRLFKGLLLI